MPLKLTCLIFFLFSCVLCWADAGLKQGTHYKVFKAKGQVHMTCGELEANFQCEREITLPSESSHFYAEGLEKADKVTLSLIDEDGTKIAKSGAFDNSLGLTKKPFSLRGKTLIGHGLLPLGNTRLTYEITHKEILKSTGEIEVLVEEISDRTCESLALTSSKQTPCLYSLNACDLYFYHSASCLQ